MIRSTSRLPIVLTFAALLHAVDATATDVATATDTSLAVHLRCRGVVQNFASISDKLRSQSKSHCDLTAAVLSELAFKAGCYQEHGELLSKCSSREMIAASLLRLAQWAAHRRESDMLHRLYQLSRDDDLNAVQDHVGALLAESYAIDGRAREMHETLAKISSLSIHVQALVECASVFDKAGDKETRGDLRKEALQLLLVTENSALVAATSGLAVEYARIGDYEHAHRLLLKHHALGGSCIDVVPVVTELCRRGLTAAPPTDVVRQCNRVLSLVECDHYAEECHSAIVREYLSNGLIDKALDYRLHIDQLDLATEMMLIRAKIKRKNNTSLRDEASRLSQPLLKAILLLDIASVVAGGDDHDDANDLAEAIESALGTVDNRPRDESLWIEAHGRYCMLLAKLGHSHKAQVMMASVLAKIGRLHFDEPVQARGEALSRIYFVASRVARVIGAEECERSALEQSWMHGKSFAAESRVIATLSDIGRFGEAVRLISKSRSGDGASILYAIVGYAGREREVECLNAVSHDCEELEARRRIAITEAGLFQASSWIEPEFLRGPAIQWLDRQ